MRPHIVIRVPVGAIATLACTICGAERDLGSSISIDTARELLATFGGMHNDCGVRARPGYASSATETSPAGPVETPTSARRPPRPSDYTAALFDDRPED